MKNVMISGPSQGYQEFREAIVQCVQTVGLHANAFEYAKPSFSDNVFEISLELVRRSDLLICYIPDRINLMEHDAEYNPHNRSLTELEFDEAIAQGIPVILLTFGSKYSVNVNDNDSNALSRANEFRERAMTKSLYSSQSFDNMRQLQSVVMMELQRLLNDPSPHEKKVLDITTDAPNAREILREQKLPLQYISSIVRTELHKHEEIIRISNELDPDTKEKSAKQIKKILESLDELSLKLEQPLDDLPESWGTEFAKELKKGIEDICRAKHLASITVPTGLILGCGALGALFGGPVGFGAGSVFGHLLSGQMKPGAATQKIGDTFKADDNA